MAFYHFFVLKFIKHLVNFINFSYLCRVFFKSILINLKIFFIMKGNLLLGTATGKLGDVVLTRKNGEQQARVRVRKIANPKTDGQNVQRLIITLVSRAYSRLRSLADHSFQGFETGSPCQSRFNQLNMNLARQAAAIEIAGQGTTGDFWNFIDRETYGLAYNPYYIATGSLANNLAVTLGGEEGTTEPSLLLNIDLADNTLSYQDVCDLIGCQPGDQLTFAVMFGLHASFAGVAKGFTYGRVILWPSNGDMSSPFVNGSGEIQFPNARNEGKVKFVYDSSDNCYVEVNGITPTPVSSTVDDNKYGAMAVVISRLEGSTWQRSNSIFVVAQTRGVSGLGITDLYPNYAGGGNIQFSNPLYLNNAEGGVNGNNSDVHSLAEVMAGSSVVTPDASNTYNVPGGSTLKVAVHGSRIATPTVDPSNMASFTSSEFGDDDAWVYTFAVTSPAQSTTFNITIGGVVVKFKTVA